MNTKPQRLVVSTTNQSFDYNAQEHSKLLVSVPPFTPSNVINWVSNQYVEINYGPISDPTNTRLLGWVHSCGNVFALPTGEWRVYYRKVSDRGAALGATILLDVSLIKGLPEPFEYTRQIPLLTSPAFAPFGSEQMQFELLAPTAATTGTVTITEPDGVTQPFGPFTVRAGEAPKTTPPKRIAGNSTNFIVKYKGHR